MRKWRTLSACLIISLGGCFSGQRLTRSQSERQWDRLCARLSCTQVTAILASAPASAITPRETASLRRVAHSAAPAIVRILVSRAGQPAPRKAAANVWKTDMRNGGTGVIVSSDGLILTNEHVIRDAEAISVELQDGSVLPVVKAAIHPTWDLALLRVEADRLPFLSPRTGRVSPATLVAVVAAADDAQLPRWRAGMVTRTDVSMQNELDPSRRRYYGGLIESTVPVDRGYSGGALIDEHGRFVGLNVAAAGKNPSSPRRAYAVPFNYETLAFIARHRN